MREGEWRKKKSKNKQILNLKREKKIKKKEAVEKLSHANDWSPLLVTWDKATHKEKTQY